MTTTMERITERIDVGEITAQAKEVRPGRTFLTLIGVFLWAIGWCAAKLAGVAWLGLAWCGVAVRTGWREARGAKIGPDVSKVMAENRELRLQLQRGEGGEALAQNAAMRAEIERLRAQLARMQP